MAYPSRRLVDNLLESKKKKRGRGYQGDGGVNHVKSVDSSVSKEAVVFSVCAPKVSLFAGCASVCFLLVSRGFSVCVHVVLGSFGGSSQRG